MSQTKGKSEGPNNPSGYIAIIIIIIIIIIILQKLFEGKSLFYLFYLVSWYPLTRLPTVHRLACGLLLDLAFRRSMLP